ncbi:MAG: hypothetical protein Ct9H300mP27_07310 [Chloroflexota bacterium]|nr:MAG: hypothetical protein Ct9H300mP27_07310 [Chloroflexota bacterium]
MERRTTETSPTALISLNLDGLKFIQHSDPGEYQTIHWLLKNSIGKGRYLRRAEMIIRTRKNIQ